VNLSDLAAKGATPAAALLSLALSGDEAWDVSFLDGIEAACESYGLALVGGDTISLPRGAPRVFGMTAIGRAGERVPLRSGGKDGDALWVAGTLGDAASGLKQLLADKSATGPLVDVYRRPVPLLATGQALAPVANAMMDVSDGLLLDAMRLAEASGLGAEIDLDTLPLSRAFIAEHSADQNARLFAATGGDDYALLAALPAETDPLRLSLPKGTTIVRVGSLVAGGSLLSLLSGGRAVPLPEQLGFEHQGHEHRGNSSPPVADCS
jgi:thiamine-monophosphate kinase